MNCEARGLAGEAPALQRFSARRGVSVAFLHEQPRPVSACYRPLFGEDALCSHASALRWAIAPGSARKLSISLWTRILLRAPLNAKSSVNIPVLGQEILLQKLRALPPLPWKK